MKIKKKYCYLREDGSVEMLRNGKYMWNFEDEEWEVVPLKVRMQLLLDKILRFRI